MSYDRGSSRYTDDQGRSRGVEVKVDLEIEIGLAPGTEVRKKVSLLKRTKTFYHKVSKKKRDQDKQEEQKT